MTKREGRLFRLIGAMEEQRRTWSVFESSTSERNREIAHQADREVRRVHESLTERDKSEIRGQALCVRQVICQRADEYLVVANAVKGADLADKGGPLVDYLA